jgi:hypothetical protein
MGSRPIIAIAALTSVLILAAIVASLILITGGDEATAGTSAGPAFHLGLE